MSARSTIDYTLFILRESGRSFAGNRGLEKAAMLAYYSLFSLFPLLTLVLFLLGRFLVSSQKALQGLQSVVTRIFPLFSDVVTREVFALAAQRTWGFVSLLILFWGVTPLTSALRRTFDAIFKTDRGLPYLTEKLLDIVAGLGMMLLLLALVAGEIAYSVAIRRVPVQLSVLMRVGERLTPLLITILLLTLVLLAYAPVRLRLWPALAGAAVTALLLAVLGPLFTAVLKFNPNYGFMFGSLKALFLLLVWVYAAFAAILVGVEVCANLHRGEALLVRELLSSANKGRSVERLARLTQNWAAGTVVFQEGEPGDTMFYIVAGAVTLSREGRPLRVLGAGEYFGEMAMLLKCPRTATATVTAPDTRLIAIAAPNMETVLRESPALVLTLLREMAGRLRHTDELLPPAPAANIPDHAPET